MSVAYTMTTADEALEAAFEAGALKLCSKHQYIIIRTTPDPKVRWKAYEIGAAKIDRGLFSSQPSQLVLAINTILELAEDECRCCAYTRAYMALPAVERNTRKPCRCGQFTCPIFGQSRIASKAA